MYGDCVEEKIEGTVGKYRVLQCIGSGGFSKVYRVEDVHICKEFAMKVVKASPKGDDESEPKFLMQLEHKGLPVLHDVFYYEDKVCIVMELAKGITLKEYVESRGKLTVKEGLGLGRELAEILKYLHSRPVPVIHGDLKPQNIMVDKTGISLIDFGGAFLQYDVRDVFLGTPGYVAPELKEGELFTQSDVYAFGMVLLFMLTGREPYLFQTQHINRSLKYYGIPRRIRKIIGKCAEKQFFYRYQSGLELQEALLKTKVNVNFILGQWMGRIAGLLQITGLLSMFFILYGYDIWTKKEAVFFFIINVCIILLGSIWKKCSARSYKTAILECECSMFVSQGL